MTLIREDGLIWKQMQIYTTTWVTVFTWCSATVTFFLNSSLSLCLLLLLYLQRDYCVFNRIKGNHMEKKLSSLVMKLSVMSYGGRILQINASCSCQHLGNKNVKIWH